jgi:DNA-binding MarR family transcriptional regulator
MTMEGLKMIESTEVIAPAATSALHMKPVGAAYMSEFKPTLTEEEKAYMRTLALALEPFRALRTTMPMQYIITFLMVATDEGLGVTEYAEKAGVSPTVMTRHLLDIGDRNRAKEEGFGLVTQERDKFDLRRTHSRITPKGKALISKVINALKTAPKASR